MSSSHALRRCAATACRVLPHSSRFEGSAPRRLQQRCPYQASQQRAVQVRAAQPQSKIQAEKWRAHGSMFTTQAVFALWYIVGHAVLSENDPLTFALMREMLSAIALLALAASTEGQIHVKSRGDLIDICVLGALCYAIVMGFMFALADIPEVQVAIAQPLVPALALGMSALAGSETLSWVAGSGILFSIFGAVSFTFFNSASSTAANGHFFGYAALAMELLAYAGQAVYLPKISKKYGTVTLTAMYYTLASLATALTLFVRERDELSEMFSEMRIFADPIIAGTLVFAILGPTIFAFTAMSFSSQKLKPSITSSYITLQPMIVALLSLLLFGKTLDPPEVASGSMVLFGLYLTIIGNPRLDREWAEYWSDLPANVPQTIATVADASVAAASDLRDNVAEVTDTVIGTVSDATSAVVESLPLGNSSTSDANSDGDVGFHSNGDTRRNGTAQPEREPVETRRD